MQVKFRCTSIIVKPKGKPGQNITLGDGPTACNHMVVHQDDRMLLIHFCRDEATADEKGAPGWASMPYQAIVFNWDAIDEYKCEGIHARIVKAVPVPVQEAHTTPWPTSQQPGRRTRKPAVTPGSEPKIALSEPKTDTPDSGPLSGGEV